MSLPVTDENDIIQLLDVYSWVIALCIRNFGFADNRPLTGLNNYSLDIIGFFIAPGRTINTIIIV